MSVLAWPDDLVPTRASFWLETPRRDLESPWTRQAQRLDFAASRWRARLDFGALQIEQWAALTGLLAAAGGTGALGLVDPTYGGPAGSVQTLHVATAAAAMATAVEIENTTNGWTLAPGDRIGLAGRVYMVTGEVAAAGLAAAVPIAPPLRAAVAAAAPVTWSAASLVLPMTVADDETGELEAVVSARDPLAAGSLELVEA